MLPAFRAIDSDFRISSPKLLTVIANVLTLSTTAWSSSCDALTFIASLSAFNDTCSCVDRVASSASNRPAWSSSTNALNSSNSSSKCSSGASAVRTAWNVLPTLSFSSASSPSCLSRWSSFWNVTFALSSMFLFRVLTSWFNAACVPSIFLSNLSTCFSWSFDKFPSLSESWMTLLRSALSRSSVDTRRNKANTASAHGSSSSAPAITSALSLRPWRNATPSPPPAFC
mmetsp:Transcript_11040/g.32660  ORF Transcript_11040/g.32660 Transcript_11040/m.32660 type:complete len:228 (-) Transcript_11040:332-1015(-)